METLGRAYDDAVPALPRNVCSVYWWCPEIVELHLHAACLRAKRRMQRTHIYDGDKRSEVRSEAYKASKLHNEIKSRKRMCIRPVSQQERLDWAGVIPTGQPWLGRKALWHPRYAAEDRENTVLTPQDNIMTKTNFWRDETQRDR